MLHGGSGVRVSLSGSDLNEVFQAMEHTLVKRGFELEAITSETNEPTEPVAESPKKKMGRPRKVSVE